MIRLGNFDNIVSPGSLDKYKKLVESTTRVNPDLVKGSDKLNFVKHTPDANQSMTVTTVQQSLIKLGFFPGGQIDGICGYRTLSAIRLFQEHVRTIEKISISPDGIFGPNTQQHLQRWLDNHILPDWQPTIQKWKNNTTDTGEYYKWLALLQKVKEKYDNHPGRMIQLVNTYQGNSDTKKVSEWDFNPRLMHLIGVRRHESSGKFDDIFIFLIKGLVFKFQGSTEPGSSSSPKGTPFLVQGQHDYHFGWHQKKYLALRPEHLGDGKGVLVVRSKENKRLEDHDLDNGLEPNYTINIHWGGKGISFDVNNWSEGCQVINGSMYLNHKNELINCSSFVAKNNTEVSSRKTRGAYNVLLDLATALSSDMGSRTVKYMLLEEGDMALDPELSAGLADARTKAGTLLG